MPFSSAVDQRSLTQDIFSEKRKVEIIFNQIRVLASTGLFEIPKSWETAVPSLVEMKLFLIAQSEQIDHADINRLHLVASVAVDDIARYFGTIFLEETQNKLLSQKKEAIIEMAKEPVSTETLMNPTAQTLIKLEFKKTFALHAACFYFACSEDEARLKAQVFVEIHRKEKNINEEIIFPNLDFSKLTQEEYERFYCHVFCLLGGLAQVAEIPETNISAFDPRNPNVRLLLEKTNQSKESYQAFYNELQKLRNRHDEVRAYLRGISNPPFTCQEVDEILNKYTGSPAQRGITRTGSRGMVATVAGKFSSMFHHGSQPVEVRDNGNIAVPSVISDTRSRSSTEADTKGGVPVGRRSSFS